MAKKKRRTSASKLEPSYISAVEIGGWPALGGDLRLELEPKWTVLFGRNAAGKSAILDGIEDATRRIFGPSRAPQSFLFEISRSSKKLIVFKYEWGPSTRARGLRFVAQDETRATRWTERCWIVGDDKPLWTADRGRVRVRWKREEARIPDGHSQLEFTPVKWPPRYMGVWSHVQYKALFTNHVPAGVPRSREERQEVVFTRHSTSEGWGLSNPELRSSRFGWMLLELAWVHETGAWVYDEFIELGRRLALFRNFEFVRFEPSRQVARSEELATFSVDGVNAGLLSDGTLRVLEILWALLNSAGGMVLIEEPETGIHPGMLSSLLNIIESYSADRQIVFSTHSPLVVSRASPSALRLVERHQGKTTVRKLTKKEAASAARYLESEGTLGEFVYSGGIDTDA